MAGIHLRPAVFLDRDGTLIVDQGYGSDPGRVKLYESAAITIAKLNARQIPVIIATNQSGIARGLFAPADVEAVHDRINELLRPYHASINAFFYCPHHPAGVVPEFAIECSCRKPAPGMLLQAANEFGIDLKRSLMIGDKLSDVEAGLAAGTFVALVRTGEGCETEANLSESRRGNTPICDTVADAVAGWPIFQLS